MLRAVVDAEDAIDEATSAADVGSSKPAPDLVHLALRKARARPQQAVFVGDTVWDVTACQRAGVPCIGLRSGGISAEELGDAGASAVFAGRRSCSSEQLGGCRGTPRVAMPGDGRRQLRHAGVCKTGNGC